MSNLRFAPTVDPLSFEVWRLSEGWPRRLGRVFKVSARAWMNSFSPKHFRKKRTAGAALEGIGR